MSLVFKNRTDISPLNPLAAIFLCMANVSDLRDFILSNTYKDLRFPNSTLSSVTYILTAKRKGFLKILLYW